jgi:hypothetical protein
MSGGGGEDEDDFFHPYKNPFLGNVSLWEEFQWNTLSKDSHSCCNIVHKDKK